MRSRSKQCPEWKRKCNLKLLVWQQLFWSLLVVYISNSHAKPRPSRGQTCLITLGQEWVQRPRVILSRVRETSTKCVDCRPKCESEWSESTNTSTSLDLDFDGDSDLDKYTLLKFKFDSNSYTLSRKGLSRPIRSSKNSNTKRLFLIAWPFFSMLRVIHQWAPARSLSISFIEKTFFSKKEASKISWQSLLIHAIDH